MARNILLACTLGVVFALGLLIGKRYLGDHHSSTDRISEVMSLIDEYYVDSIDMAQIDQRIIPLILSELDPHSAYLSAEDNRAESESLEGSFQGIGVQFNRLTDTVIVTRVIAGGGAERAGLKAGDRILKADTTSLVGSALTNDFVMGQLKGPGGTVVRLGILRKGQPLEASVVRGPVPVSTLDASYRTEDGFLYIRLNKWGAQSYRELLGAYARHTPSTIKGIIVDLRDNGGGYLDSAVELAGAFLPRDTRVVYAQGRHFPAYDYMTMSDGLLLEMPLVVLVNEFSASSSEIFAGAMQDYDRAQIIGRRTFGKGLVQRPFILADSSVVRLTVARYYTPSGRSIQRSYAGGVEEYARDLEERFIHGELYSADSIAQGDTTTFRTRSGRIVHGGGGITPDIFVPRDSTAITSYYIRLVQSGTLVRYAFEYADQRRERLSDLSPSALHQHLKEQAGTILFDYAYYAQSHGIPIRTTLLHKSSELILSQLYALIAENVCADPGAYYEILNDYSPEVQRALDCLRQGSWRPSLPAVSPASTRETHSDTPPTA